MKNLVSKKSSWLMAAVMMGAAGLTGCSNESVVEEQAPVNPTYNGESVKTQFAINIPYANPSKRMTDDNTQQDGKNFLGMSNIRLIPYKDGTLWDRAISKILALGDIGSDNDISNSGGEGTHEITKTYRDVDIPVGITNFLFYGEGTKTGTDDAEKNKNNGALVATIDGLTSRDNISFALKKVYEGNDFGDTQAALIALLNGVENATDGSTTWESYKDNTAISGNAYILKNLYNNYTTHMKAGSANSILKLMQALYTELDKFDNAGGSSNEEKVAAAIMTAITTAYSSNSSKAQISVSGSDFSWGSSSDDVKNFPRNLGLPDGAVRVKFETNAFASDNFTLTVGGAQAVDIKNITYPASLYYFVDSELGAKDDAAATFPAAGSWGTEAWSGWVSSVTASTRVIAMKEPVEYGVGLLATKVKLKSLTLLDNKNNTLTFTTGSPFELTGVLIGGQPNSVKWNMVQAYDDVTGNRTQTIYDAAVAATTTVSTSEMTTPNYTLALDNSKFTDADQGTRAAAALQDNVNIAIELVNNSGQNFAGVDGTVYAGATFYLVAQLDPDGTGVTNAGTESVFMKDYKTTANLTVNSLKNAYNVLPDLRSTTLQFGLAVDLDWEEGLIFNVGIE